MRQPVLFLISFIFLSLLISYNVYNSYQHFGQLVYPLDDAYIHMAISKNLQQHGIWGVTRFEFSSTSSSILYTLVLSFSFALFGIKAWLPLAINWLAAAAVIWLVSKISLRFMNAFAAVVANLLFIALVPLSGMAVLGMEHCLQILFCTWFTWLSYRKWKGEKVSDAGYAAIAFLAVATRYESIFLIGLAGALWLFFYKNWKQVIMLAIAAILPICIFGFYAIAQGGYFVPNSLLAKSNYVNEGVGGFITEAVKKIINNSMLAALIVIPFAYWQLFPLRIRNEFRLRPEHQVISLVGFTAIIHQVFASFGWMFRYEAYLIAILFVACIITWKDWKSLFNDRNTLSKLVVAVFSFFLLIPLIMRIQIPAFTNRAMKNIHDQHLQMAGFVHDHFPGAGIAMNDIGTTTFFNNDMRLFDMEGLGTLEILKMKKQFDSSFLSQYVSRHRIDIGIFYPHLYKGKIPSTWEQVGSWEIKDRFVAAGSEVGFFAINPASREKLVKALQLYASKLPKDVKQKGVYMQQLPFQSYP